MSEQSQENFIDEAQRRRAELSHLQPDAQEVSEEMLRQSAERNGSGPSIDQRQFTPPEPNVPGVTRPEIPAEQPALTSVEDINNSLSRGVEAIEGDLKKVLEGKIEGGGPEAWTNMIAELQDKADKG